MSKQQDLLVATTAIALLFFVGCAGKEPALRMGEERVVFIGTVKQVEPLGHREAVVYPVGADPRFLLVVRVDAIEENRSSPIANNTVINFAIHSPSQLLITDNPIGGRFRFRATWVFGPEKYNGFSWLEASPQVTSAR